MSRGSYLAAALALLGVMATSARAEIDVSDRLQLGGPPLILEGTLKYGQAERYVFSLRRAARVSAAVSKTNHPDIILQLLSDAGDPNKYVQSQFFEYRIEGRGVSLKQYIVLIRWYPFIDYEVAPPPSPYRVELKVD